MIWELQRHQWDKLRAGADPSKLPGAINDLIAASSQEQAQRACWRIDRIVAPQGTVYQVALAAVPCLIAGLQMCTNEARIFIFELLCQIGSGEALPSETEAGLPDLIHGCRQEIARGIYFYLHSFQYSNNDTLMSMCVELMALSCMGDPAVRDQVHWYFAQAYSGTLSENLQALIQNWVEDLWPEKTLDGSA